MKRFIAVLSGLLVLPAFAEVAPVYYDEIVEYTDDMLNDENFADGAEENAIQQKNVAQRNTINRTTSASRAVSASTNSASQRSNTATRAMASSPRSTTNAARGTVARTARKSTATRVTPRGATNAKPVTARASSSNSAIHGNRTVLTTAETSSTLTDSGTPLYNSNSARVSIRSRTTPVSSARLSTPTATVTAATPALTETEVKTTTDTMSAIAELTEYCKAQYAACMDNYCNVLDDNQGRCSCSKNVKNYAKTEEALTKATEEFQEVVQKIRYIGLTGKQIEALFAETEAELAMNENSDSSQLKSSLDAIKRKVVDVSTPSAAGSYEVTSGLSLDLNGLLNADFSAGFDLNSFLGTTKNTNTTSVTNQRGEQLYKSATSRCKTAVLNSCVSQGVDANVIANSYDLEIDKQCIVYERALTDANKEMKNNVFNASNILQQARLLLAQNKNSYDLRGCVAAIDSCMQDEYVCGADYEFCLDPTGKYIANGEVVKGGTPGISGGQPKNTEDITTANVDSWNTQGMYDLYQAWNYDDSSASKNKLRNAWGRGQDERLENYVNYAFDLWNKDDEKTDNSSNLAVYLLQKIGYIDKNDKVHGMCASVMKQCQDYTFEEGKSGKSYIADNEVVRMYLNTTLPKIKVQQDEIIANYAESCRADVQSCLASNGYDDSNTKTTASKTAINSCAAEITTCMSVGGFMPKDGTKLTLAAMRDWVNTIYSDATECAANYYLSLGLCVPCPSIEVATYHSEGNFYNNMGASSGEPTGTGAPTLVAGVSAGGTSTSCTCPQGYTVFYGTHETSTKGDYWNGSYDRVSDESGRTPDNMRCLEPNE